MTTIKAEMIADSVNPVDVRLCTVKLEFPHVILPQVLMHRSFSRSVSSSRAIPTKVLISRVENDPYIPLEWRYKGKGMQPGDLMNHRDKVTAQYNYSHALGYTLLCVKELRDINGSKEMVNRLLEPFSHVQMVVTATDWNNFFNLRIHEDAQNEVTILAQEIRNAMDNSVPKRLISGEWHLPFSDINTGVSYTINELLRICTARCARTSYLLHNGKVSDPEKDLVLHDDLLSSGHMNPFEHCAMAESHNRYIRNFRGFSQYRNVVDDSREWHEMGELV